MRGLKQCIEMKDEDFNLSMLHAKATMAHAKMLVQLYYECEEVFVALKVKSQILTLGDLLTHLKHAMDAFVEHYPIMSI